MNVMQNEVKETHEWAIRCRSVVLRALDSLLAAQPAEDFASSAHTPQKVAGLSGARGGRPERSDHGKMRFPPQLPQNPPSVPALLDPVGGSELRRAEGQGLHPKETGETGSEAGLS